MHFLPALKKWLFSPPEQPTDPSPQRHLRPLTERESTLRHMRRLALVAERVTFARNLGAGAVFTDSRGHGYSSFCGYWFNHCYHIVCFRKPFWVSQSAAAEGCQGRTGPGYSPPKNTHVFHSGGRHKRNAGPAPLSRVLPGDLIYSTPVISLIAANLITIILAILGSWDLAQ